MEAVIWDKRERLGVAGQSAGERGSTAWGPVCHFCADYHGGKNYQYLSQTQPLNFGLKYNVKALF